MWCPYGGAAEASIPAYAGLTFHAEFHNPGIEPLPPHTRG